MSSSAFPASVGISILVTAIVVQSGALFLLYRRLKRVRERCEEALSTCDTLRDDVSGLRTRVRSLEQQQSHESQPRVPQIVTFAPSQNFSTPVERTPSMSRVGSMNSGEFEDALEYWPTDNDSVALLIDEKRQGSNGDSAGQRQVNFDEIDKLHEEGDEAKTCYDQLKRMLDSGRNNPEVLWRFARACYSLGNTHDHKSSKRKELIQEGHTQAVAAYKLNDKNFNVVKWAAILTGALTEFLGTKEKIKEGFNFKEYLDKGLAMNATEYSMLHMRGRFSFDVANLSWLERKAAAAFFATPPTATIDEALADFLEVEKYKPEWIENLLYITRCYLAKGDKSKAKQYLNKCLSIEPADDAEKGIQHEAKKFAKGL